MSKTLGIIGLVAGLLAVVGVFGTWVTISGAGIEYSASGWELATGTKMTAPMGITLDIPGRPLPWLALIGGVLAIVGGVTAAAKPGMVPKLLLAIGGILALIGVASGLSAIDAPKLMGMSTKADYGTYLVAIGGVLAILTTLGLKEGEAQKVSEVW